MINHAKIEFNAIVKRHKKNHSIQNIVSREAEFYKEKEAIKKALAEFIYKSTFASITKKDVLHLVYLNYIYNAVAHHALAAKCENQFSLLNPKTE